MVSSNLTLIRRSHRIHSFLFMQIVRGLINEGGVMSSEYGKGKIVLCMYRCSSQRWVRIMSMKQHQTSHRFSEHLWVWFNLNKYSTALSL